MALKVGNKAPDFTLPDSTGKMVDFYSDVSGYSIVYFYPKDFTPGCTLEACEFSDQFHYFSDLGIPIFGISMDTVATHQKFRSRYQLEFELLSDVSGQTTREYGALIPVLNLPKRISYLIDDQKIIQMVIENFFQSKKHISKLKRHLRNHVL